MNLLDTLKGLAKDVFKDVFGDLLGWKYKYNVNYCKFSTYL